MVAKGMEQEPAGPIAIINSLLQGRQASTIDLFCARFREQALRSYEDYSLVVISYESLSGTDPTVVVKPAIETTPLITYRYIRQKDGKNLDVYVQLRLTKEQLIAYRYDRRPIALQRSVEAQKYLPFVAKSWAGSAELAARGMDGDWLEDLNILSILTLKLVSICSLTPEAAINLMMTLEQGKPYVGIRDEYRELQALARTDTAFEHLAINVEPDTLADYVDKHGTACIYSEQLIRIQELPGGCGFTDLLPRKYFIEPFVAIMHDTLDRPLVELSEIEKQRVTSLDKTSPELRKPRRYYVLRRGLRTETERAKINEYLSIGCFATRLLIFKQHADAELLLKKVLHHFGRSQQRYAIVVNTN